MVFEIDAQESRKQMLHQKTDSLKQLPADTSLIKSYFDLAHFYLRQDSAKSAFFANRALQVADSIDSEMGKGIGNMALGIHYIIQGNYTLGLKHSFTAESIFKELERDENLAMVNSYIGIAYSRLGNNNKALQYYLQADSLMKFAGNPMQQAQIKANIGIIYSSQGHYGETIRFFKEAMPTIKQFGAPPHIALGYHNIGVAFRHLAEYDSALVYLNKAYELRLNSNDNFGLASSLQNLGKVYGELGQYEFALDYLKRAINIQQEMGDQGLLLTSYIDVSHMYHQIGLIDQAKSYAQNALEISARIGDLNHQAESYALLSEFEEEQGDIEKAFQYLKKHQSLQDSLIEQNRSEAFEEMRARYETQEMEQQIELLEQEQALYQSRLSRSQLFRNSLIGSFIALSIILALLYLRYRTGKEYQAELQSKNEKLEELSKEKSEYLHIAAHDLKSPLSSILGLAELMKDEVTSTEEAKQHAEFIYISAFRMHDLIKQFLNVDAIESGNRMVKIRSVDLKHDVLQIVEHFKYRAQWKDLKIHVELAEEKLNAMADPSIFREILDNLISNAVKYSPQGKQIWVKGTSTDQKIRIEVKDEGPGISSDDQQLLFKKYTRLTPEPTGGEGTTGLGLYIAKKMTEAMNGEIWCESDGMNGSTFIIELPKSS